MTKASSLESVCPEPLGATRNTDLDLGDRVRRSKAHLWRPGNYLRSSARLLLWLLIRAGAQAATVVLLARSLGPQGYGAFVATVAIASFLTPVAGLGLHAIVLRDGATSHQAASVLLRQALRIWSRSAPIASIAGIVVAKVALPASAGFVPIALLVIGECVSGSLVEILARARQAQQRPEQYGALMSGLSLARLGGAFILLLGGAMSLGAWMLTYCASSVTYAALALLYTRRTFKDPCSTAPLPSEHGLLRSSLPFMGGALAFRIQAEINKPLLAHVGYALAGNFNAAQRALDLTSLPLTALQEALWPRVFAGSAPDRQLLRVGTLLFVLALAAGAVLTLAAPLVPALLGKGFVDTALVLRWLAWLPAVQVLRNLGNTNLMTRRNAGALWRVYLGGTGLGSAFAVWSIAAHGIYGAIISAYVNELIMLAAQAWFGRAASKQAGLGG